jgi:hypothetical protein
MRQTRIERKVRRHREDRTAILSIELRDPDILRAKRLVDASQRVRSRI